MAGKDEMFYLFYKLRHNKLYFIAEMSANHGGSLSNALGIVRRLGTQRLAKKLLESAVELCGNYSDRGRIAGVMSKVADGRWVELIAETIIQRWGECINVEEVK